MSKRGKRKDNIIDQIRNAKHLSPAPTDVSLPTLDDFREMITMIKKNAPDEFNEDIPGNDFFETYKHLFDKSREELEQLIPDGAYNIGSGKWYVITGKGGLINAILTFNEDMKNAALNFKP